ncbi:phosphopantetheine-binding protein [Desulfurivibrio dismutans]|uniref:phosphopantetheine-binding protein n=1 Tax=Desulfurivibrio dismutans TaxID=1398908 RepID=UPI0023DA8927|nr:phosphopantetheine-binding protein [Desulfurivibrio alkaliphilus]MDF1614728.1 phosphopantetheine-binding protein [Desulfurivibrio alkaliphilus]
MEDLKEKLKHILIDEIKLQGITPADIKDDMPLFGDGLGLDSLDAVELVVLIQKHFGVQISDMEEGKKAFTSIANLADYIREHQA